MSCKKVCVLLLVCAVATNVWAADIMWFGGDNEGGGAAPRDWATSANWNADPLPSGPVPGAADKAKVDLVWGNPGPIVSTPGAIANELFIAEGGAALPGYQDVTAAAGGDLTVLSQILLGYYAVDSGGLVCDGGTITSNGHLFVGFMGTGTVTVNSGTIRVDQMFGLSWNGGDGHAQLNGGTLSTAQFAFENVAPGIASMDVAGGVWEQDGAKKAEIDALVLAGKIYTSLPGYTVDVTQDPVNMVTRVQAVPEPATMILLGLGGLLIRRRRA